MMPFFKKEGTREIGALAMSCFTRDVEDEKGIPRVLFGFEFPGLGEMVFTPDEMQKVSDAMLAYAKKAAADMTTTKRLMMKEAKMKANAVSPDDKN